MKWHIFFQIVQATFVLRDDVQTVSFFDPDGRFIMGQLINSDRVEFAGDAWTKNQPVITTTTATVKDFKLLDTNFQECPVQSGSKK